MLGQISDLGRVAGVPLETPISHQRNEVKNPPVSLHTLQSLLEVEAKDSPIKTLSAPPRRLERFEQTFGLGTQVRQQLLITSGVQEIQGKAENRRQVSFKLERQSFV